MPVGSARAARRGRLPVAIPDSENLHAHYDFSQEDGSMPVADLSDNGYDLDQGTYSGVGAAINGVQSGEFDGIGDGLYGPTFADLGDYSIYAVAELDSEATTTDETKIVVALDGSELAFLGWSDAFSNGWSHFTADGHADGSSDTSIQQLTGHTDGSTDVLREEGSQVGTSNNGGRGFNAIGIGLRFDNTGNYWHGAIGEVLIYDVEHDSTTLADVESYLSDKWGLGI